ncbi:rhodanese-like domain-containing protein [Streptomyces sp. KLOTTS4A1]|uniref:sulfurtransferase n=1 Tax=Streptomyces sp. KLOTTS4A1 TaxID=3390996 RepID=UPI0039F5E77E
MHPIISAAELASESNGESPPVLLDVRWQMTLAGGSGFDGRAAYAAGHIPGAAYVDLDTALAGPPGAGGRHPLPEPEVFASVMRAAGVRSDRPVVIYDGGQSWAAARAWWLLRWAGHHSVRVLDGGLKAWTAGRTPAPTAPAPDGTTVAPAPTAPALYASPAPDASPAAQREAGTPSLAPGDLESGTPPVTPGDFVPRPGSLPVLDADEAAALARSGLLLDARAGERYRGEVEPIDRVGGHIPGAVSAPTTENAAPDGHFRTAAELATRFHALGADKAPRVGVYCGSGVSAAHEILALAIAGIEAELYAGSWSNWSSDESRPVATGPNP